MKIIIVESPKKAKTIKKFLKNRRILVISSKGHIVDLPKNKFGIYIEEGGKLKVEYVLLKYFFLNYLKKLKNNINEFILATDPDREGEFIAWSIVEFLKLKNYSRIRFYEISKNAILNALQNKESINLNLVKAQKARRFLDRIIGYTLSPILWKEKIGESAGRVQSSALRIIVEKEEEIKKFKEEKFYKLEVDFGSFKAYYVENKNDKFKDKDYLEKIKKEIKEKEFILNKIEIKQQPIKKPTPLDTALLQRVSYLKYKFSAPLTMRVAQSLYEKGFITYHRTDSFNLSKEFLEKIKGILGEYYERPYIKKSEFSQEAHEAIRPVYIKRDVNLKDIEKKLYELIFDFTLASCSKDGLLEKIVFILNPLSRKNLLFKAEGEKLVFDGFLKFYPFKISFKELPNLERGTILKAKNIKILEVKTKPPSRYSEATLIKKLKELGIGRPSTYAEIIKTLLKRKYIIKEKGYLKPTEKGVRVIEFLKSHFKDIIDLNFTAKMEKNLDEIAKGLRDYEKFVIDFWKFLKSLL